MILLGVTSRRRNEARDRYSEATREVVTRALPGCNLGGAISRRGRKSSVRAQLADADARVAGKVLS